ncbi:MAG TPA: c-type cytochrome [Solirubrobacterales bacterium]|jgi:mono/diheme cytochrome c family protein
MNKKVFIAFGIAIAFLAVIVPFLVFDSNGDATSNGQEVPASLKTGQELFQVNCGTCHTLYAAGTDGNYGPDLDELLAPGGPPEGEKAAETIKGTKGRVLNAIEHGVDSEFPGRMPAGILNSIQAHEVAEFVATVAGRG